MLFKNFAKLIVSRTYSTYRKKLITETPPPKSARLCNELRLEVSQDPLIVTIHGYFRAYIDMLKMSTPLYYLINNQPTEEDWYFAKQELLRLDAASRWCLKSMWMHKREEFMEREFVKHSFIAERMYKKEYFEKTYSVASEYFIGTKNIKMFLEANFKPGQYYDSGDVNQMLNEFVGARVKIRFKNVGPTTLGEIGILYDDERDNLMNHPDSCISSVDMIVISEPKDKDEV